MGIIVDNVVIDKVKLTPIERDVKQGPVAFDLDSMATT
jgi:hypothetical protein